MRAGVFLASFFWAAVHGWGGKLISFCITVVLARILSPEDYGIAGAVVIFVNFLPIIAEQGYSLGIVQKKDLYHSDVNLPFYISIFIASNFVVFSVIFSEEISKTLGVENAAAYFSIAVFLVLVYVPNRFQEAWYQKKFKFKQLALRRVFADITGGVVAIICALNGAGVWSLLIQLYISAIVSTIVIWSRPVWRPTTNLRKDNFRDINRISHPVFFDRTRDYVSNRIIDIYLLRTFELASYGMYLVSFRLFQLMLDLLYNAFSNVAISGISNSDYSLADLKSLYLKSSKIAMTLSPPLFLFVGIFSEEISHIVYGDKWQGISTFLLPLMIMGALQSVQFVNGTFLNGMGYTGSVFAVGMTRTIFTLCFFLFFDIPDLEFAVIGFVVCQVMTSPLSYTLTYRKLHFDIKAYILMVLKCMTQLCIALISTLLVYNTAILFNSTLLNVLIYGFVFFGSYFLAFIISDYSQFLLYKEWVESKVISKLGKVNNG